MARRCLAFLGQCHTTGYRGLSMDETFPEIVRRSIEAARPEASIRVMTEPFHHPSDLPGAVRRALRRGPDVVVVEVVGWVAVSGRQAVDLSRLPRRLRSPYERLRHIRRTAAGIRRRWPVTAGLISGLEMSLQSLAAGPLRPLVPRLPRPNLFDYEVALEEAARILAAAEGVDAVFQGPGAFNEAIDSSGVASNPQEVYRDVNAMTRRVAERHGALFVERLAGAPLSPGAFYLPGSIRPSRMGHEAWGRLLAEHLDRASLV